MLNKKESKRLLCVLLSLALVLSLTVVAMAQGSGSLPPYDANVSSITVNGYNVSDYDRNVKPLEGSTPSEPKNRVIYDVVLPANTPENATFTLDFTKPSGVVISPIPPSAYLPQIMMHASTSYSITLNSGVASKGLYVYKCINPPQNVKLNYHDFYVFNFVIK